ncbi:MAG: ATP-binding protein [Pseudomonadota bacterium]
MTLIDPKEPLEAQLLRQTKIIDALMRRAGRQKSMDFSAFSAFQSAMELQERVDAQSRDLERATTELESARYERERTRKSLIEALSSMEEGIALFYDDKLEICNELFQRLLPDVTECLRPGLDIRAYFRFMFESKHLVSFDGKSPLELGRSKPALDRASVGSIILELMHDRWYQLGVQHTSPSYVVLLLTEITSIVRRNRTEREHLIDRQADYLQAVFQSSSSGMCTYSSSGEIMMLNPRFRQLLGVPFTVAQEGASLEGLLDYIGSRSLISDRAMLKSSFWRGELKRKGRLQKRVRHHHDRVLDVQANTLPGGGFLVELKDVTLEARTTETLEKRVAERTAELTETNARLTEQYEKKALVEEELRVAKERAEEAVSSKTRFLAAASHDLLQPVNAAKLLIFTLREAARKTDLKSMVERLEKAFSSSEYLLRSLLDISRLESRDPNAVSPSNVSLGGILENVQAEQNVVAVQKGIRLTVVPTSVVVHSDPVYLLRSAQNLIANAIQYTKPGGRVLVGCRRRGNKVVLEVWDTGIGITKEDQARIFDEFTRANNARPGSGVGLGLSIVESACRHLGHKVWVRSTPGQGSVFSIEMDLVGSERKSSVSADQLSTQDDESLDRIVLVIENDEDVLFATTTHLESWGASVLAARSTAEARGLVMDMGMSPDIILADYQLDGDDRGTDAIAKLRAMTGVHIPAILITANRSRTLRLNGARDDITLMTKPVDIEELTRMIESKIRQNELETAASAGIDQETPTKVGHDKTAGLGTV